MSERGEVVCEQLVWTWNGATLAETGTGYGPVGRSAGWPFDVYADSTGGLGGRTKYLAPDAEAVLAERAPPPGLALSVHQGGKLLVCKEFLGEDAFGRNSRWLVHALFDATGQVHPADVLAASAAGLLAADVGSGEIPVRTDLPPIRIPIAPPPAATLERHEPLLARLLPGIIMLRQDPQLRPIVVWAKDSGDIASLLTSLVAVLPRAFSASLNFSTFEARPAPGDAEIVGAIEHFSADPRREPDLHWIDLIENATNLPPPRTQDGDITAELLDVARSGQRPPDLLATAAELLPWARARIAHRAAMDANSRLQQGLPLDAGFDPALIDVIIELGEALPEADRARWLRQPGVAARVAGSGSVPGSAAGPVAGSVPGPVPWSAMAQTLVLGTLAGEPWHEQFAVLLAQHPVTVTGLLTDHVDRQPIDDAVLLTLTRSLPVDALPIVFDVLVASGKVHAGFLLFDVLADPRLEPELVRRKVLEPLLARHWSMLGQHANLPPAVVTSLSVRSPSEPKAPNLPGDARRQPPKQPPPQDPPPEGLRRWLTGRR